jgi:hypothetical protein
MFRQALEVSIVSLLATVAGGKPNGLHWHGHVPLDLPASALADPQAVDTVNEAIFRYFQRVGPLTEDKLEALEYRLPSVSCGDVIAWGGAAYRVLVVGFEPIEPPAVLSATIRHRPPGAPAPELRELIGEYVRSHPDATAALNAALTALARLCLESQTEPASIPVLAELGLTDAVIRAAFG